MASVFVEVDDACKAFLRDRTEWSLVEYRWDNPDRLLSGPVHDGMWGNIHILFLPDASNFDASNFRFTYAIWRDEDQGIHGGHRVSKRVWSTSDDDGRGDEYLSLKEATAPAVKRMLEECWLLLLRLSSHGKFREELIGLPL